MKKRTQNGFGHLGSLLLLVIVVLIALIGYKVYNNRNNMVATNTAPAASQQAQPIKNAADLNNAESTLNSQNIDGDLNPDSLNQDVQSLL